MADWALSTNLYTWAQVQQGFFGWPTEGAEADRIRTMKVGDAIVPKYAQTPAWEPDRDADFQRQYLAAIEANYDEALNSYAESIRGGAGAVPHILRVVALRPDDMRAGSPWASVSIAVEMLPYPLSTKEFLRLREIPPATAAQFKGSVAQGRHVQELPDGAATGVARAGCSPEREGHLRRYSLIRATSAEQALERLNGAGRTPVPGDRAYVVAAGGLYGVFECVVAGELKSVSSAIPRPPGELTDLFNEAKRKSAKNDYFAPLHAEAALAEIVGLLQGADDLVPIDDFGRWHDRYELLAGKVTQAYDLAARPEPPASAGDDTLESAAETGDNAEAIEAAALAGLTIEAIRAELPAHMALPDDVLREIVTALRSGKHLLLGGPPGTGKSTLAEAVARAVVGTSYDVTTATADWTTFDTIGGYLPDTKNGVEFFPGVVLRTLRDGSWLIIDELNRADIDKAFGALFTLLNGDGGRATRRATLPYHDGGGKPISIAWAERREGETYAITPHWRLIGTLNLADKASLFQLSFAFLRRFAVVDVPLPPEAEYRALLEHLFAEIDHDAREQIIAAALAIAFGPIPIGPAILSDVAKFVAKGVTPVAAGGPTYADPVQAFLVATKLLVVAQYEGAEPGDGKKLLASLKSLWPDRQDETWRPLRSALEGVSLK